MPPRMMFARPQPFSCDDMELDPDDEAFIEEIIQQGIISGALNPIRLELDRLRMRIDFVE